MKHSRLLSLIGPVAAAISLKCPLCLLALTGLSAAIGSAAPIIHLSYKIFISALSVVFLLFLYRSWTRKHLPMWIFAIGALGVFALCIQLFVNMAQALAYLPLGFLSVASIAVFLQRPFASNRTSASCVNCISHVSEKKLEP